MVAPRYLVHPTEKQVKHMMDHGRVTTKLKPLGYSLGVLLILMQMYELHHLL